MQKCYDTWRAGVHFVTFRRWWAVIQSNWICCETSTLFIWSRYVQFLLLPKADEGVQYASFPWVERPKVWTSFWCLEALRVWCFELITEQWVQNGSFTCWYDGSTFCWAAQSSHMSQCCFPLALRVWEVTLRMWMRWFRTSKVFEYCLKNDIPIWIILTVRRIMNVCSKCWPEMKERNKIHLGTCKIIPLAFCTLMSSESNCFMKDMGLAVSTRRTSVFEMAF